MAEVKITILCDNINSINYGFKKDQGFSAAVEIEDMKGNIRDLIRYSENYSCALTPAENILDVVVCIGEKNYPHENK